MTTKRVFTPRLVADGFTDNRAALAAAIKAAYPLPQQPDECMDAYLKRLGK